MPGSSPAESAPVMASGCGLWAAVEPNEPPVDPWADLHARVLADPYRSGPLSPDAAPAKQPAVDMTTLLARRGIVVTHENRA